jgi:glyoxylase-like metal-dependent hydrolase (beta-lactamase superfamily II)
MRARATGDKSALARIVSVAATDVARYCRAMRTLSALAVVAALAATLAHAQSSPVRTADPAKRGVLLTAFPRIVQLAPSVYGYEEIRQPGFTTVSMFVVGRDGVLIADGQGSVQATQTMLDRIRTVTPLPIKWYVVGSDHGDHTAGNSVLPPNVTYVVHRNSKAQLERDAAAAKVANDKATADAAAKGTAAPPPRVVIVPPVAMVADSQDIDLGGIGVRVLFLGRAHTGGDLMVLVPSEKILFMSEVYLNRVFPAMRSAAPAEWVTTVDRALARNVTRFVPGHGFIEEPAISREELVTFRASLVAVIAEATRLHDAHVPIDDAIKQANWGEYGSWFLADQQAAIAVRRVYDALDGKLR